MNGLTLVLFGAMGAIATARWTPPGASGGPAVV